MVSRSFSWLSHRTLPCIGNRNDPIIGIFLKMLMVCIASFINLEKGSFKGVKLREQTVFSKIPPVVLP